MFHRVHLTWFSLCCALWWFGKIRSDQLMITSSNGNIFRVTGLSAGNSPVNPPPPPPPPTTHTHTHKGQWREALMFSLINACINSWGNSREAGDLRRHPAPYDVIIFGITPPILSVCNTIFRLVTMLLKGHTTVESPWYGGCWCPGAK